MIGPKRQSYGISMKDTIASNRIESDGIGAQAEKAPIFNSPDTTAIALGISRSAVYELLRAGELASVRHGKRRLISRASVEAWARRQLAEAGFDGEVGVDRGPR